MENAEEIFHFLEEFSKRKPKTIPQELNEYLAYVARTGDPVYHWSLVKSLFKEKLLNVITDFYETTPGIEIPPYPNVDPFNYDTMKNSLIERLDSFTSAPFTVQRICELLTCPRKQYNRVDKFMRAIEKNILVVSTREPGPQRYPEPENGEANEPIVNGSDNHSEYNVDVEMEDISWKDKAEQVNSEPQPSSSDAHISVDDLEARLKAKQGTTLDTHGKSSSEYESVTPPELNTTNEEPAEETVSESNPQASTSNAEEPKIENKSAESSSTVVDESKDVEMKSEEPSTPALVIPEIKVDDAEMTEQKLKEQSSNIDNPQNEGVVEKDTANIDTKVEMDSQPITTDESSSDSNCKEETETKHVSEVSTSSEESSSSSDNTDGNSNSPKSSDQQLDVQEEVSQPETKLEEKQEDPQETKIEVKSEKPILRIETDNYSISDMNSELPQPPCDHKKDEIIEEKKENADCDNVDEAPKVENNEEKTETVVSTTEVVENKAVI